MIPVLFFCGCFIVGAVENAVLVECSAHLSPGIRSRVAVLCTREGGSVLPASAACTTVVSEYSRVVFGVYFVAAGVAEVLVPSTHMWQPTHFREHYYCLMVPPPRVWMYSPLAPPQIVHHISREAGEKIAPSRVMQVLLRTVLALWYVFFFFFFERDPLAD